MKGWLAFAVLGLWVATAIGMPMPTPATDEMTMQQIENYYTTLGYMGDSMPDSEIAELVKTNMSMAYQMATKIFQRKYRRWGLKETGELDAETMHLLSAMRCGNKDIVTMEDTGMDMRRKKRYAVAGTTWDKQDLTYKVTQYPRDYDLTPDQVDREVARAFQVWADVTPLRFYRLEDGSSQELDIEIQFSVTGPSDHGDGYPFDGESGTLAHAFFPWSNKLGGDAHFDEAEQWTIDTYEGINFFIVAAHEFGHSLGLSHSEYPDALMAPFYSGYTEDFRLAPDDIMGIQYLYGTPADRRPDTTTPRPEATTTPTTPTTTTTTAVPPTMKPEGCNICREAKFDAITTLEENREEKVYGFRGEHYFLLENGVIADGYPRRIDEGWQGLPNNIDAAIYWKGRWEWSRDESRWVWQNAATFVFKGNQYWRVEDMTVAAGPRPVSDWGSGFPTDIDAAMVWRRNGKSYFFKGDQYYRYSEGEGIDPGYPRRLSAWGGVPNNVDAALQTADGHHVFFKDELHYYFDSSTGNVFPEYPRLNRHYWLRCHNTQCSRRRNNNRRNGHRHNKHGIPDLRNIGRQ